MKGGVTIMPIMNFQKTEVYNANLVADYCKCRDDISIDDLIIVFRNYIIITCAKCRKRIL